MTIDLPENRYYTTEQDDRIVLFDRLAIGGDRPIYETHTDNTRKLLDDCDKLNTAWNLMRSRMEGLSELERVV